METSEPTPGPSQEGSWHFDAVGEFPSREGPGVGCSEIVSTVKFAFLAGSAHRFIGDFQLCHSKHDSPTTFGI